MIRFSSMFPTFAFDESFPLWWLLVPVAVFGLLWSFYAFFSMYHLWRYGTMSLRTPLAVILFCAGILIIVSTTMTELSSVSWTSSVQKEDITSPLPIDRFFLPL